MKRILFLILAPLSALTSAWAGSEDPRGWAVFNGTDQAAVVGEAVTSLLLGESFSIEFWCRRDLEQPGTVLGTASGGLRVAFAENPTRLEFGWGGDETTVDVDADLGLWTHWVCTYDGSSFRRVYRNGDLVVEDEGPRPLATAGPLGIGALSDLSSHFAGAVDEVRVWDYALPAAEVQQRMHRPLTSAEAARSELIAWYPLDALTDEAAGEPGAVSYTHLRAHET